MPESSPKENRPNPVVNELIKDYGGNNIPADLQDFADVIQLCTVTGLPKEMYLPDPNIKGQEYTDICAYINFAPYLIFNSDLTEEEIYIIRKKMAEFAEKNDKMPSDMFEGSKLRSNRITDTLSAIRVLLTIMETHPLYETLPPDSPLRIDDEEMAAISRQVNTVWKKETAVKISDSFPELPWHKMYEVVDKIRENSNRIKNHEDPIPVTIDGHIVSEEMYDDIFKLVTKDECGDYFNIDKKILLVRTILLPFLKKVLLSYEAFYELTRIVKVNSFDGELIKETIQKKKAEQTGGKRNSVL